MSFKSVCSKLLILSILLSGITIQKVSAQEVFNEQNTEISSESNLNSTMAQLQENISDNGFKFKENENLSLEEIQQRMLEIDTNYEVNDLLSESDSEFIIGYYNTLNELMNNNSGRSKRSASNKLFKRTTLKTAKRSVSGVTAQLSGSVWTSTSKSIFDPNNSFGGTIALKILGGASKVKKVTGAIHLSGYGLIGSNKVIGKVADEKISDSWSKAPFASHTMNRSKPYTGIILYTSVYAEMVVKTKTTSFDLHAGGK